jgi:hypothetical protein
VAGQIPPNPLIKSEIGVQAEAAKIKRKKKKEKNLSA